MFGNRLKEDIYIRVLKYAASKGIGGFTLKELNSDLNLSDDEKHFIEMNTMSTDNSVFWYSTPERRKVTLSFDGRAMLLEHEELRDARKSSKRAMTIAIISIILNVIGIAYQLL